MCVHLLIFLIILSRNQTAAAFHDGCWFTKSLLVAGLFTGSMWISNDFMEGYLVVTKWVGTGFLIYQAMLMLISAYKVNDQLVANYEKDQGKCSAIILMGTTVGITALNIFWIVKSFMSFRCGYNIIIQIVTIVGILVMYGLVLLRSRKDASILTSSMASCYCLYLQWTAMSSDNDPHCNDNLYEASNTVWQIVIGLFFTIFCLSIVSASKQSEDETNLTSSVGSHLIEQERDLDDKEDMEDAKEENALNRNPKDKSSHVFAISQATITFQACMILSAMYMAMLCTNWGDVTLFENTTSFFEHSNGTYWLKITAEWITLALYIFSLVAPLLCPNRSFE